MASALRSGRRGRGFESRLPDHFWIPACAGMTLYFMVRAHIHFCGTVQGVGFRYTTLSFAKELSLTGWVKNLSNGNVEAVAEGPRAQIEALIERLKGQFDGYIRDIQIEWLEAKQEFREFSVV